MYAAFNGRGFSHEPAVDGAGPLVAQGAVGKDRPRGPVNGVARSAGYVLACVMIEDGGRRSTMAGGMAIVARRLALVRAENVARETRCLVMFGRS
jgi:hypothetical protein